MQTSLARRQRHRRGAFRGRPRGSSVTRRILIAIPILLFAVFLLIGVAGLVTAAAAYNYYSQGLPDPKDTLSNLSFDQQTVITDRTGNTELARLGDFKRDVVTFDEIPPELLDATTAIEDKDFWTNPGFDFFGFVSATLDTLTGHPRGGSTITQQLVRARLLPAEAFAGTREERKIREIIQSPRLTQAYPGEQGKQDIITAYLNQNFYGNQSYGVAAAAETYFGKALSQLTLAQDAVLAAIPQSPTAYDLVKNADSQCTKPGVSLDNCPDADVELVVDPTSEIYARRNYVLELMKTRSPLSGSKHTAQEYQDAENQPIVLAPQLGNQWLAPQFVLQVRDQLGSILCPEVSTDACDKIDTGGYHVTTTLDMKMQSTVQKWLYAAAIAPNHPNVTTTLRNLKIPSKDWGWLENLAGKNIHNAASAVEDYRTGQILAYAGSASFTSRATRKFQPQFDVLSDGWRQPGSSIKPVNYAIGIEDKTMTAATLFMDVATNFGGNFIPTQADHYERGPVRLREALQFSLNIPSIKAGLMNGLDHFYQRSKDFGISYVPGSVPVTSMSIGTIETHPIDMIGAYGAIADGGKLMPRTMILKITDSDGNVVYPVPGSKPPKGTKAVSAQTAYIITNILAGNTTPKVNPFWGEWAIYDHGVRRPAAYKTGTTSDNRDVHAYGFLAPPADPKAPALVVGVWMGNSDNSPNTDTLSLKSSAPLWSRILGAVSAGTPMANFRQPNGLVTATIDANTGFKPGPWTTHTTTELFLPGTQPTSTDDFHRTVQIDAASGLLWQAGCVGPETTVGALDLSQVEAAYPNWQRYDNTWAKRAARGPGTGGGLKGTRVMYFYQPGFSPFGKGWGGIFAPTKLCPLAPATPPPCDNFLGLFCPPPPSGEPPPSPTPSPTKKPPHP